MKIPTLLGLLILFLFVVGLVLATVYFQKLTKTIPSNKINSTQTANIADTTASVVWFSNTPLQTQIFSGISKDFSTLTLQPQHDDRDKNNIIKRHTHITTFKNLKPSQNYFIKIFDDDKKIAEVEPEFTTLAAPQEASNTATLVGSVVDQNLHPINDALVIFGEGKNTTVVTVSDQGNYLLPINTSSNIISFIITDGSLKSQVIVPSTSTNTPIPSVVLGQNLDLSNFTIPSPSPQVQGVATTSADIAKTKFSKFDLNEDGTINSIDLTILQRNIGKNSKDPKWESLKFMDLNSDGKIDSKDLTLLKTSLR